MCFWTCLTYRKWPKLVHIGIFIYQDWNTSWSWEFLNKFVKKSPVLNCKKQVENLRYCLNQSRRYALMNAAFAVLCLFCFLENGDPHRDYIQKTEMFFWILLQLHLPSVTVFSKENKSCFTLKTPLIRANRRYSTQNA